VAKPIGKTPLKAAPVKKAAPKLTQVTKGASISKAPVVSQKTIAPKPAQPVKGKVAPKKAGISTGSSKVKTPAMPVVKAVVGTKKEEPKVVAPKPKVTPVSSGSKVTDVTKKQTVSTASTPAKPKEPVQVKITEKKIIQPLTERTAKHVEKMAEKKEHKPVSATATTEEPQKSRYSDKELEEFDQLIDQKLIVAREQLEFYLKQLEDMAENPDNKIKGLDDGLSSLESERISSMASRQQKLIQHLENAKIRIKNKVYGICRETGKLISKERLRAVPHATLSIEAKQAQN
jgi:RNA polymerase-binding transcription factor DksA